MSTGQRSVEPARENNKLARGVSQEQFCEEHDTITQTDGSQRIVSLLVERGIRQAQAEKLVGQLRAGVLPRVEAIIRYFDDLCCSPQGRVMRSPAGFLYRAVQDPDKFVLPASYESKQGQDGARPRQGALLLDVSKANSSGGDDARTQYLIARKRELHRLKRTIEPALLERMSNEVRSALVKLQGLISEARFEEAVEHGVEEKVAKLFAVPDFEQWILRRGKVH